MTKRTLAEIKAGILPPEVQQQIKEDYGLELTTLREMAEHGLLPGVKPMTTRH